MLLWIHVKGPEVNGRTLVPLGGRRSFDERQMAMRLWLRLWMESWLTRGVVFAILAPLAIVAAEAYLPGRAGPLVHGTVTGFMPFGRARGMDSQVVVTLDDGTVVLFWASDAGNAPPVEAQGAQVFLRRSTSAIFHRTGYSFVRLDLLREDRAGAGAFFAAP
jgi:hypothetical protein